MFKAFERDHSGTVDRTFHPLTVTALHLSVTIVFNLIVELDTRTEPEAQAAAQELIYICYWLARPDIFRHLGR
jgi:hypothetical protein